MSKLIQVCDDKGLRIPEDPRPLEIVLADKVSEALYVIRECSANKTPAWFSTVDPFRRRRSVALMVTKTRQEMAKLWLRSQVGSLRGKPRKIPRDRIFADFLKKKGLK